MPLILRTARPVNRQSGNRVLLFDGDRAALLQIALHGGQYAGRDRG